ncbi:hypothetical protein AMIS_48530 [Actinoplanes missouriensis 431]|uniref:AB hydrolase-1 domain-containing protein n=1 Tax=Actinoplanes missouriensis (strain ATCC 14538 / DSM 43046 / CBS 188.64 / JCM 3121 / NBRC 102363 / NCIMB 12654 / NRRL B-3342 / UNCC 431) TaxID=512565 RepID=I0HAN6_ACTM4|nr:alpha/beta hydrolase [Actinoplanes missouriensis]BAL90073.1 hypothetical protein AMIS_48530 [Actinoplanes missouriensis 431]
MPIHTGADGAQLYHDDTHPGSAEPPLIVLAGGAARHPDYFGDLGGLGARQRLVIPHLRGVGRSPGGQHGSYWEQAADLEGLREHLGLDRIRLAGHSAGTRLATAYAARFPERLDRLILITPPATHLVGVAADTDRLRARRGGEPVFDAAVAAAAEGPDLSGEDAFHAWYARCAPLGYAAWTRIEQEHARAGRFALPAMRAYFGVEPPADFAALLGRVTAPVTVIAGAEDCLTGLAPVVALADIFPDGEAVVIEDCGHYPWVEKPAEFVAAMLGKRSNG